MNISLNKNYYLILIYASLPFFIAIMPLAYGQSAETNNLYVSAKIEKDQGEYQLGKYLYLLEDPDDKIKAEDIYSGSYDDKFVKSFSDGINHGFTKSVFWARVDLENHSDKTELLLLEIDYPLIDIVKFFAPKSNGAGYDYTLAGDLLEFSQRAVKFRNIIFPLTLEKGAKKRLYFYYKTDGSLKFALNGYKPVKFAEKISYEQLGFGIYYGMLTIMAVYNLFIFFSVRSVGYLIYVFFIIFALLTQLSLDGLAFEYFWPNSPWWFNRSLPFFMAVLMFFTIQFGRSYLKTYENVQKIDKCLKVYLFVALVLACLALIQPYSYSILQAIAFVLVIIATLIPVALITLKQGYRPAKYFLLAWLGAFIGGTVLVLKFLGILPVIFITEYALHIGLVMQVVLLSLGLADRINVMQKEQEEANAKVATEKLESQQKTTIILEEKVTERTKALRSALETTKKKEVEMQRINEQLGRQNEIFKGLIEMSDIDNQGNAIEDVFKTTLLNLNQLFPKSGFAIFFRFNHDKLAFDYKEFMNFSKSLQNYLFSHVQMFEEKLTKEFLSENETLIPFAEVDPENALMLNNCFITPITVGQSSKIAGGIVLSGVQLDELSLEVVSLFFEKVSAIAKHTMLTQRLELMANTDLLTGCYNRNKLNSVVENSENLTLIYLKVENLKFINDGLGINAGDKVIIQMTDVIKDIIQGLGELYRFSNSEFGVLADITEDEGIALAKTIKKEISTAHLVYHNTRVVMTLNIGIANQKSGDLFGHALLALTESKKSKKVVLYSTELNAQEEYLNNLLESKSVQEAFEENLFFPVFQGIHDNRKDSKTYGQIIKFECLMRLKSGERELSPFFFIKALERSHEISKATQLMIMKSFDMMSQNDYDFNINLTEQDMLNDTFMDFLEYQLEGNKIKASRVTFEILESIGEMDSQTSVDFFRKLKKIGCKIAVDDFGAEQSNIGRLLNIEPDFIKIDAKFIKNIMNDQKSRIIVENVFDLATRIGCEVVAEFVENEDIQDVLEEIGIQYSQGYLFSKPSKEIITELFDK